MNKCQIDKCIGSRPSNPKKNVLNICLKLIIDTKLWMSVRESDMTMGLLKAYRHAVCIYNIKKRPDSDFIYSSQVLTFHFLQ